MPEVRATSVAHAHTEPLTERDLAYAVAHLVAERRTELLWSQAELARQAGMKPPHISRLESANKLPNLTTLLRLANAMGVTLKISFEKKDQVHEQDQ